MKIGAVLGWLVLVGLASLVLTVSPTYGQGDRRPLKKGILLVAFGSTTPEAQISFENIERSVKEAFPGVPVYWSYTSRIIIDKMAKAGKYLATPEEALTHTHRNVLYRAIGQAGSLEVDTYLQPFPASSCLLLCSDGLWGMVSDEEIADILMYAPNPRQALEQMVAVANQKGGDDNITAVLVFMGET